MPISYILCLYLCLCLYLMHYVDIVTCGKPIANGYPMAAVVSYHTIILSHYHTTIPLTCLSYSYISLVTCHLSLVTCHLQFKKYILS